MTITPFMFGVLATLAAQAILGALVAIITRLMEQHGKNKAAMLAVMEAIEQFKGEEDDERNRE